MTTPNIPQWVQAAIDKIAEKHDEKRQTFKERGDRYHDGFADGLEAAETIFMRELERAEPQSGWISVADRLPENGAECLVWKEPRSSGYGSCGYIFSTFENGAFDDIYPNEIVTHWQPLPQPPKE